MSDLAEHIRHKSRSRNSAASLKWICCQVCLMFNVCVLFVKISPPPTIKSSSNHLGFFTLGGKLWGGRLFWLIKKCHWESKNFITFGNTKKQKTLCFFLSWQLLLYFMRVLGGATPPPPFPHPPLELLNAIDYNNISVLYGFTSVGSEN